MYLEVSLTAIFQCANCDMTKTLTLLQGNEEAHYLTEKLNFFVSIGFELQIFFSAFQCVILDNNSFLQNFQSDQPWSGDDSMWIMSGFVCHT